MSPVLEDKGDSCVKRLGRTRLHALEPQAKGPCFWLDDCGNTVVRPKARIDEDGDPGNRRYRLLQ